MEIFPFYCANSNAMYFFVVANNNKFVVRSGFETKWLSFPVLIPCETCLTHRVGVLGTFMFKVLSKQSIIPVFTLMDHGEK